MAKRVLAEPVSTINDVVENADLYLLCISDKNIAEVAKKLPEVKGIVAHTSGSVSMDVLSQFQEYGVFYPLQTFKKSAEVVFEKGPSVDVILQWATYYDASDQTSLSRIWGGIHPPIDDIRGRIIGEKIGVAKFERVDAAYVASYIHGSYRMGVLVGLSSESAEVGKDLAMQIAAMNPVAVDPESVPAETVARERAIIIDTMKEDPKMAGKPEEMIAKIAEGKINAFFKEQTLLAQAFVKDGGKTVGEYVKSVDGALVVTEFKRVALG